MEPPAELADGSQPDVKSQRFADQGVDVTVSNSEGYLCKVRMKFIIDMPPAEVFSLFTNPDNSRVFRQIDRTIKHEVTEEDEQQRKVIVEQESTVGALWFKQTFTTALDVVERKDCFESEFKLARPGIMSAFSGHWKLSEWNGDTDVNAAAAAAAAGAGSSPGEPQDTSGPSGQCLAYLEQDVAPAIAQRVPGFFHGLLRKVCANACVGIYQDLQVCAALRHRGFDVPDILAAQIHGRGGLKQKLGKLPYVPATGGLKRPTPAEKLSFSTLRIRAFSAPAPLAVSATTSSSNAPALTAFHIDDISGSESGGSTGLP